MKTVDVWVTGSCALVVALYAMQRYDTPETNRLSTTRRLFLASGAGYVAASLLVYALLTGVVLKPGMLQLFGFQEVTKLLAQYTAPPVLAAVVLTTLLPQAPVLKRVDAVLLEWFQKLGRIPSGVSHLADALTLERITLTGSDLDLSRDWITREGDVPNDLATRLATDSPTTTQGRFTALLVMHRSIEALGAELSYKPYFKKHAEAWRQLRNRFHVFAAQSQAFFVLFDQLGPRAEDEASGDALKQARACYLAMGEEARGAMAEFLARALMAVEPSSAGVAQRLRRLGFAEEIVCPRPPVGAFVFVGTMLVVALLGMVCLMPPPGDAVSGPVVALVIGVTQTCALLFATLPKASWAAFRRKPDGSLPYLGWLAAAAAAGAVALLIERGVIVLAQRNWADALPTDEFPLSPAAFMAAGVALVVSILCDVDLKLKRLRRLTEGVLVGMAMMFCIALCIGLLKTPPSTKNAAPHWWFPFAFSFSLGFVAGAIAPHLYRAARESAPGSSGQIRTASAMPAQTA